MSIKGMNHAVLYVRDARAHKEFYSRVFGFITNIEDSRIKLFMGTGITNIKNRVVHTFYAHLNLSKTWSDGQTKIQLDFMKQQLEN
jgi:catechol 2,3-dioxygenase-like lactoylglutathione lyase family enzyme